MDNKIKENSENEKKEKGSTKAMVTLVIIVLLGVNALLLWQFFSKKSALDSTQQTLENVSEEKESLQSELDDLKTEYDKMSEENSSLQVQLSDKDEEIKVKVLEIQNLIRSGDAAQLKKAKLEMNKLRELNRIYIAQIDSLNTVSQALNKENIKLTSNLKEEQSRVQNLNSANTALSNKVAVGSIMKTESVVASGVKYKSSGKELETNRASSTENIKTCFTLAENLVVDQGKKTIFVRVLGPDGSILSTSTETFLYKGQPSIYSAKETIDYANERTDMCVYWSKGSAYAKGDYTVELYTDGNQIGVTKFSLK